VCLRKSPVRTLAFLAANRSNAQRYTGPRTPAGKARSSLNALKHGKYARRLPEKLLAAGAGGVAGLFERFGQQISPTYRPESALEAIRHNWRRNETGMSFRMSTLTLAERAERKKDVKNEVQSHHVVENKHKCLWNEAIF